jgi:hypothetical protein
MVQWEGQISTNESQEPIAEFKERYPMFNSRTTYLLGRREV